MLTAWLLLVKCFSVIFSQGHTRQSSPIQFSQRLYCESVCFQELSKRIVCRLLCKELAQNIFSFFYFPLERSRLFLIPATFLAVHSNDISNEFAGGVRVVLRSCNILVVSIFIWNGKSFLAPRAYYKKWDAQTSSDHATAAVCIRTSHNNYFSVVWMSWRRGLVFNWLNQISLTVLRGQH